ncbi:MAG: FapA family protein [Butyrivibrio sp.]|nr:FapA family protein [Butyrivibrio sp.]
MAIEYTEIETEKPSYSSLDSFGENSLEQELKLCKEVGADVDKLKSLKFNALQLTQIRRGIVDQVDVSKYMDPKLSWIEMEELRLEMFQNIDMSSYRKEGFDVMQLTEIRKGLAAGLDVSVYAKKDFFADQMRQIRLGMTKEIDVPVVFYSDPEFDSLQMREIRKGLMANIDISSFAKVSMPYLKMRAIREAAEDGLVFTDEQINRYNANILMQIHKAHNDGVDISKYLAKRFDDEQLEEVRIALKEKLPINKYASEEMRGDAIKEVRLGLESGVDVTQYANAAFGWQQMRELRLGLEHQIDVTPYKKPLYQADQMREIRLGIEEALDISKYASMMYTARDMRRIREKLITGEYYLEEATKRADGSTSGMSIPKGNVVLNAMLINRDRYLSVQEEGMICYMSLPEKGMEEIDEEFIRKFLQMSKIVQGIKDDAIKEILEEKDPSKTYLVAHGVEPVDGEDGYYEFFFDTNPKEELEIMRDGNADLSNALSLQQVKVGDKVAFYHRATKGKAGFDVHGNYLQAHNGKEIPIVKGTGFMILNDRVTYVATYSGAISMKDGQIMIQKLLVMPEVKITDKRIKYDGTVYITGNVNSGSQIEATGDVVIEGHMESSEIICGGNVVIKGGVTCPIRGSIIANGDVSAKYFEGASVSGINISANYFINCTVNSKGLVKTLGRVGTLYGGTVNSLYGLEVASLGNKTGARTIINLGVNSNILNKYNTIKKNIVTEEEQLAVLSKEKERLMEMGAGNRQMMQWKVKINAAVSSKEIRIKELNHEKELLETEIGKGDRARATITECLYANCVFVIGGVIYRSEEDRRTYDSLAVRLDGKRENIIID